MGEQNWTFAEIVSSQVVSSSDGSRYEDLDPAVITPFDSDNNSSSSMDNSSNNQSSSSSSSSLSSTGNRDADLAWVEVSVQAIIFVFALLSNALVIVALARQLRRKPSSRMYRLMYHLSVADLLVALFNVLPQLIWDITFRFHGPDLLCRVVKFGQVFPLYLSSFLLTLMAVDRVGVTRHHQQRGPKRLLGRRFSGPGALLPLILAAWMLAFVLALPQMFIFSMTQVDAEGTYDCWAEFAGNKSLEKAYVILFLVVVFFLPFVVISASYCIVTHRIWSYSKSVKLLCSNNSNSNVNNSSSYHNNGGTAATAAAAAVTSSNNKSLDPDEEEEAATLDTGLYEMKVMYGEVLNGSRRCQHQHHLQQHPSQVQQQQQQQRLQQHRPYVMHTSSRQIVLLSKAKRKSLEMTATVSICFAVCWLPWCITMLLLAFEVPVGELHPVLVILALLASLNSTTNPWIYLCFSSAVLQQVKQLVGLRSTLGGPDSLGGADADRAAGDPQQYPMQYHGGAKRILFKRQQQQQQQQQHLPMLANSGSRNVNNNDGRRTRSEPVQQQKAESH